MCWLVAPFLCRVHAWQVRDFGTVGELFFFFILVVVFVFLLFLRRICLAPAPILNFDLADLMQVHAPPSCRIGHTPPPDVVRFDGGGRPVCQKVFRVKSLSQSMRRLRQIRIPAS